MKRYRLSIVGGLAAGTLFLAWLFLAPPQLGGSAGYAVISGSSMEPHIHKGDLVITRRQKSYQVGDVVAYFSPTLSRRVLHRVVARDGERYVLKGDNNSFVDPDEVTQAALIGERWARIPGAGSVLVRLRSPLALAIVAALLVLGVAAGTTAVRRRRRSGNARPAPAGHPRAADRLWLPHVSTHGPLQVLVGTALIALVLAAVAFTRSPTRSVREAGLYELQGAFRYSGKTREGAVYQRRRLGSGDPIFFGFVRSALFRFEFDLKARLPFIGAGTASLDARLTDDKGWKQTLPLQRPTRFKGMSYVANGKVDLDELRARIVRFESATGVVGQAYSLTLQPRVSLRGTIAGERVTETFAPPLVFRLDETRIWLDHSAATPGGASMTTLQRSELGLGSRSEPNAIHVAKLTLPVGGARIGSLLALVLAVGGLVALALLTRLRGRGDEPARIAARYGEWLVPVDALELQSDAPAVAVATFDALLAVAERYDETILHEHQGAVHTYVVRHEGATYRYVAREAAPTGVHVERRAGAS